MNISHLKKEFLLNPEIVYLNFGSFGACPKPVFENYQKWQLELEREPVQFITVNGPKYLEQSRSALSDYINCNKDDIVLITNPSYGLNIVAKSFSLKAGDEILTTDLEYGASDKIWNYYCKKAGANYIRQKISLPILNKEKFISDFFKGITANTKAIFISQITSSTALILPVKEICDLAKQKGLITIVDGAHVPGHIHLNLQEIQADIYIGACHKWMMTPKGCSFLYIKKEYQSGFDPLLISWGYEADQPSHSKFLDYHQMQGTRDFSALLTIPKAIEFMHQNHWDEVATECGHLVRENANRFCDLVGSKALSPISSEFIGQMFSIPLKTKDAAAFQNYLYKTHSVEIPVMKHNNSIYARYSINAFNSQDDLNKLFTAFEFALKDGFILKP